MALTGRKPKPQGQAVNRVKPVHDWVEVENVPYMSAPKLPTKRANGHGWLAATKRWWSAISTMPHCVLWQDSDWEFAFETAEIRAEFDEGDKRLGTELRNREKKLGLTWDSRRDMRIRYVDAVAVGEEPGEVVRLDDYRNL